MPSRRVPWSSIRARTAREASSPVTVAAWQAVSVARSLSLRPSRDGRPRAHSSRTGAVTVTRPSRGTSAARSNMVPPGRRNGADGRTPLPPSFLLPYGGELQVVAPAAVPIDRGTDPRQPPGLRPVGVKRPFPVQVNGRRVGVQGGELNPAVADQPADGGIAVEDAPHGLRRGF